MGAPLGDPGVITGDSTEGVPSPAVEALATEIRPAGSRH